MTKIFLCYAREDEEMVTDLYRKLIKAGLNPWMDKKDILAGEIWEGRIDNTIKGSNFFLACLSNNSVNKRGFLQREIKTALEVWKEKLDSDIYLIPIRLEDCQVPTSLNKFQWLDLFNKDGFKRLLESIHVGMKHLEIIKLASLRSQPLDCLFDDAVNKILIERNYFEIHRNPNGKGFPHQFGAVEFDNKNLVIDYHTGLIWQQSGWERMSYENAKACIREMNRDRYAGYCNWRLPTLDEAMSLMETKKKNHDILYIDPLFDLEQKWIWTADIGHLLFPWAVDYYGACCDTVDSDLFLRGVCTHQLSS